MLICTICVEFTYVPKMSTSRWCVFNLVGLSIWEEVKTAVKMIKVYFLFSAKKLLMKIRIILLQRSKNNFSLLVHHDF